MALKTKSNPNKSQQSLANNTTRDASNVLTARRRMRRLFDKANVPSNGANEALVPTETHDASINSTPSTRRLFGKANVPSDGANEASLTTGTQDGSSKGGESTKTNQTCESGITGSK